MGSIATDFQTSAPAKPLAKKSPFGRWQIGVGLIGLTLFGAIAAQQGWLPFIPKTEPVEMEVIPSPLPTVTALGRLEPQGEMIYLSASTASQETRLEKLLVKVGDRVEAGQTIALLSGRDRWQAGLIQAQGDLQVAEARLAQVKAGAKDEDITAQSAQISQRQAQWQEDVKAKNAELKRLQAQWDGDRQIQQATLKQLQADWQGERAEIQAKLQRLQGELANAKMEYQRYQQLYTAGAISESVFDGKALAVESLQQQVKENQANLNRVNRTSVEKINAAETELTSLNQTFPQQIKSAQADLRRLQKTGVASVQEAEAQRESLANVRPVDVQVAEAEVQRAKATVQKAQTDLAQTVITASEAGEILEIYTHPGEKIADQGIVSLGQTQQMMAIAEVYQGDISRIQLGQMAKITSPILDEPLQGRVQRIDPLVQRQTIVNEDPAANIDAKVIEVRIELDPESSKRVKNLTNLQVTVTIQTPVQ
ncbi:MULTISPECIES: HlyD family secretion protein [Synechocystis]|uniref:HlyD family secretion protein n=1 Tax=Synechocystis salina LEGE 00031 TaxID=1828736 RepID=A0ABR9VUF2_9SYNC|nr:MULTISPECIES: HlyD family secretion protein [Synechocystis]MBE9194949.1 HlyD family secretion protein [Synechocystis sp. LEGE 06083]MBE9241717.1 HlyD family secretion protein [Synechocystis salina LEGE 00041]MBE9254979.1 HlyD family secretion protein [Synechocystis salina LEGE 00031]